MAENIERTSGRPAQYKTDRGGGVADSGPYIGEVMNNVDPVRAGRLQVYITEFAGSDKTNSKLWRTVSYLSPFYGKTQQFGTNQGTGSYAGNPHSYGMWFTPPDIGAKVLCFFVSGDPNQGYYVGCSMEPGENHMIPAIGASKNYKVDNNAQSQYFTNAPRLPVTEINADNQKVAENPTFFAQPKPVHSYVAGVLLQQGVLKDPIRGAIGSNAQRESPSSAYGITTPGRPVYAGGMTDADIVQRLNTGAVRKEEVTVIARRGGHSLVMDDGDISGQDQLVRIRTATGHQILLSDSGNCIHIMHANGQTWLEFGVKGTIDVYSTNSINLRSQGEINIHADKGVNINAGGAIKMRSKGQIITEAPVINMTADQAFVAYSGSYLGMKSDGSLALDSSKGGSWNGGSQLSLSAGCINLNGGSAPTVTKPKPLKKNMLADTQFSSSQGWIPQPGAIDTIVTRAPTHEPYAGHNQAVPATASLTSQPAPDVSAKVTTVLNGDGVTNASYTPINSADYITATPATSGIGSLAPETVTGLLTQSRSISGQSYNEISNANGVGQYGMSAQQLEDAGYLKPGTVEIYLSDKKTDLQSVLGSPTVWTGKDNVGSLSELLNDPKLQTRVQTNVLDNTLGALQTAGIVTGKENPTTLAPILQSAATYGADTVKNWISGKPLPSATITGLNSTSAGAIYAVNLVTEKLGNVLPKVTTEDSVDRTVVDSAVRDVVGNSKVDPPTYT